MSSKPEPSHLRRRRRWTTVAVALAIVIGSIWWFQCFFCMIGANNVNVAEIPPFCVETEMPAVDQLWEADRMRDLSRPAQVELTGSEMEELSSTEWVYRKYYSVIAKPGEVSSIAYKFSPNWRTGRAKVDKYTLPAGKGRLYSRNEQVSLYIRNGEGDFYSPNETSGVFKRSYEHLRSPAGWLPEYIFFVKRSKVTVRFARRKPLSQAHELRGLIRITGCSPFTYESWYGDDVYLLQTINPYHHIFCFPQRAQSE